MTSSGTFAEHYELSGQIGKGAYAVVYECVHRRSGRRCAVKIVDKSIAGAKDVDDLAHEITVMQKVGYHPHVLQMLDHYDTPGHLYIVLDLLRGGMLFDRLIQVNHYSERSAAAVVWRLLSALQHIHGRGICHRDLKPENLLLRVDEEHTDTHASSNHSNNNNSHVSGSTEVHETQHSNNGNNNNNNNNSSSSNSTHSASDMPFLTDVCIADFGLAGYAPCTTCCGSPAYIAPEVVCVGYYGTQLSPYDCKCDIWSLGVIAYILLSGKMPFYGANFRQTFSRIVHNEWSTDAPVWRDVSPRAVAFVHACLTPDPAQRPSATQLLQHPWLQEQQADVHLKHSLESLRQFTARQKVRAAVRVFCATHKLLGGAAMDRTPPFMRYLRHEDKYSTVVLHQSQTHSDVMHRVDFGVALLRDSNNGNNTTAHSAWRLQQCCSCSATLVCRHIQNVHEYLFVGCRAMDVFPFVDELRMMQQETEDELASDTADEAAARLRLQQVRHSLRAATAFAEELAKVPHDQLKPNLMLGDVHGAAALLSRLNGGHATAASATTPHKDNKTTATTTAQKLAAAAARAKTATHATTTSQPSRLQPPQAAAATTTAAAASAADSPHSTSLLTTSKMVSAASNSKGDGGGGSHTAPAGRTSTICDMCSLC